MKAIKHLIRLAYKLVSRNSRISDFEIYKYRDELRIYKSQLSDKWANYFESVLDKSIDLMDAIKEMKTPQGNDLLSIREQRKHLNWLENQKKILKNLLIS